MTTDTEPSAALGRRTGAAFLDLVVLIGLFVAVGIVTGNAEAESGNASVNLDGGPALLFFGLALAYYFVGEAIDGQTPGKRLAGVRVVAADGSKAGPGAVAGRTLLRVIDGLFFYAVGLLFVLISPRRQRLGDRAAKTVVVRS